MALADYYARSALAASQVLAGLDEERIRIALESVRVGLAIGTDAAQCTEGRALLDLLIRLLARLYPALVIRGGNGAEGTADDARILAQRINPTIEFPSVPTVEIVIGDAPPPGGGWPRIFVGSNGWNAFVGIKAPQSLGASENPLGAGVAACFGAANLFRFVFQGAEATLDTDSTFSILGNESHRGGDATLSGSFGEVVLVGGGAIGNAAAWALSRIPMEGVLHVVDHQAIDLGNLQRYIIAERSDEGAIKVEVLARYFKGKIHAEPHVTKFESFVASKGYTWPRMILALDSSRDRRAAQASLPEWIANAWTQPGDLGVSSHDFLNGACVGCLYLPEHTLENEDAIVASSLGVPERLMQIRTLLHDGNGVPRDLLDSIAAARGILIGRLLPFEGRPLRNLYVEGFCGGAVIPLGAVGTPRQEVHVPLAHQSALAGLLLAAAAVRQALGLNLAGTQVTRIDIMRPLGPYLSQPAAKDQRGICICQDADYREVYKRKYAKPQQIVADEATTQMSATNTLDGG
jgi:Prokaryotic E2 family C/ThiF family